MIIIIIIKSSRHANLNKQMAENFQNINITAKAMENWKVEFPAGGKTLVNFRNLKAYLRGGHLCHSFMS